MKTLDGIKKLNAVKKADGEFLIEAIDLKELKGAKERDLAEAFLTAIEGIPEKDEQFIPEELAELYNKLAEETAPEPKAEKEVVKPAAKTAKKSEAKETAKPAKAVKKPGAKENVNGAKKEGKKADKVKVNQYGHREGSGGCLIDAAFEKGGTFESIAEKLGLTVGRIKAHYLQLSNLKKVPFIVDEEKGTYKIK